MPVTCHLQRPARHILLGLALATGAAASLPLSTPVARAQSSSAMNKPMKLMRVSVVGNQRVPTADIDHAMTVSTGSTVTRADLARNLDAIIDVYRRANVGASFKQKMTMSHPGQVVVSYMIDEQAPPPPQAAAVLRTDRVTFEGNKQISSDAIRAAMPVHPGDVLDEAKERAGMQAIMALYKKGNIGVQITPNVSYPQPNHAVVDYQISETPAP